MGGPDLHLSAAEPGLLRCEQLTDLTAIFEPDVNAVVLPREGQDALTAYIANPEVHQALGAGLRLRLPSGQPVPAGVLPAAPGQEALRADIAWLSELLADLLGSPGIGVRLEVLRKPMCPRFHVDRVGIRMLCTYRGSGTEYLHGACADRNRLGLAAGVDDAASGLILDAAGIHAMPLHAVTLIKGSAWPGNEKHGAIHRSPAVPAEHMPRIVLALDAIWE